MLAPALEAMLVPRSTGSENSVLPRLYYHRGRGPRSADDRLRDDPSHNRTSRIRADYGIADVTARRYGGFAEKSHKKRAVVVARMATRGTRQSDTAVGPLGPASRVIEHTRRAGTCYDPFAGQPNDSLGNPRSFPSTRTRQGRNS
jgi:hypothetical protein